jgi:hypothetical protein
MSVAFLRYFVKLLKFLCPYFSLVMIFCTFYPGIYFLLWEIINPGRIQQFLGQDQFLCGKISYPGTNSVPFFTRILLLREHDTFTLHGSKIFSG